MKTPSPRFLVATMMAAAGFASAQTALVTTDFASHANGAATNASLNAVTTGGTWSLNAARGATYTVEEDLAGSVGDKALLLDDQTSPAPADFATLTLAAPASFASEVLAVSTRAATRRTGSARDLKVEFLGDNDGAAVGATIHWQWVSAGVGTVSFNGGAAQNTTFASLAAWDADSASVVEVSAEFYAGTVTLHFGGLSSGPLSVQNGVTAITGLRVSNTGSPAAAGLYLDDVQVISRPAVTTLLSTDFQSHAVAAATDASLNAVTSGTIGGTWTLNTGRANTTYTIEEDVTGATTGDKAFLMDDSSVTTSGKVNFTTLNLSSAADFGADEVTVSTQVAPRRVGSGRNLLFEFLGTNGTASNLVGATIDWLPAGAGSSTISFNGAAAITGLTTGFRDAWDIESTSVHDLVAVFSGSTVTLSLAGQTSGPVSVMNGVTRFTGLRISSNASAVTHGLFLDDITIKSERSTTVPPQPGYQEFHYRGLAAGDPDYNEDLIRVYLPPAGVTGSASRPGILMFHGGGWSGGSLGQFDTFCQALADMGFVAATANYRFTSNSAANAYSDKKELCVNDARLATIWFEARAADFGFADGQVMLGGGSAGGHLATMVAHQPDAFPGGAAPTFPALLLFNPAYHVDETSGSVSLLVDPERQLAELVANSQQAPPAIHFFGNYDRWRTPLVFTNASGANETGIGRALPFIDACRAAGSRAELWYAVGQDHSFFNATAWNERCIFAIDGFLNDLDIVPASPPPPAFAHPELNFVLGTEIHPWRLKWFRNEFATGNAADTANPDGDEFDNFGEFALGTNPTAADSAAPLGFDPAASTPTLRFSRRQHTYAFANPAAVVELQSSTTLAPGSWQPVILDSGNVTATSGGIETLAVPLDATASPARFYRLEIRP